MEDEAAEARQSELFVDDRGAVLRVTWHASEDVMVVSQWRDGRCVASHRLPPAESARLSALLARAAAAALAPTPDSP